METLFKENLKKTASLLLRGELVAFPTETVYGLGAPVYELETIQKIYTAKGRPQDNPLIVHIAHLSQCEELAINLPESFFHLAKAFFPGPLTLVVKKSGRVPDIVSAGLDTVAIRMPDHPIAKDLIEAVGQPLVAPSANLSGRPSSTTVEHVRADFEGKIAAVLDGGPCAKGIESTVLDLVSFNEPTVLRPGAIPKSALEKALGTSIASYTSGPKSSPGMKYRHYAPDIPVKLFSEKSLFEEYLKGAKNPYILSKLDTKTLYANLRKAESMGYDEIIIEYDEKRINEALKNRLEKITYEDCCH